MAAAIEEITVSVGHVADNAPSAQQMAVEAGGLSGQGAVAVRNAVSEMNKIADSVVRSAEVIRELGDKSAQISSIVNVIQGIAEQTNLLALNAAIEAARAGEQGRGFAVVADEVRKLAERTTTSTQQIGTMIGAIQSGTQVAVQNMEAGSAQVQEGVRLAAQAGDSMNRIELSSGNVCEAVETISSALREQNSASIQIAQSVEQIARMTEQNSAVAKESSQSAGHLERLAATLKTSVDRFKV
jgi:methyl-accepting chemotaxis protein